MDEKEELEYLRREKDRDIRFRAACGRGLALGIFVCYLYNWLTPLDTVETRSLGILLTVIAFATGFLTAHIGRFRADYKGWKKCH